MLRWEVLVVGGLHGPASRTNAGARLAVVTGDGGWRVEEETGDPPSRCRFSNVSIPLGRVVRS